MLQVVVVSPQYCSDIGVIMSTTDRASMNNYLMWQLASSFMPYLAKPFREIGFLYKKALTGVQRDLDRWDKVHLFYCKQHINYWFQLTVRGHTLRMTAIFSPFLIPPPSERKMTSLLLYTMTSLLPILTAFCRTPIPLHCVHPESILPYWKWHSSWGCSWPHFRTCLGK